MTVYTSPFMAPIRWMFGWRHDGKLTEPLASGCPVRVPEYGNETDVDSAYQISTVWACIRLIAETVSTLPLIVYRRDGSGERKVAADHDLSRLLHDAPNADSTALEFWEGVVTSLCTWGNAYSRKLKSGTRLIALEPMRADGMEVVRNSQGRRKYRYSENGKPQVELDEDDVFHIRGFGTGGDMGLSPIAYARMSLFSSRMSERASAKFFARGMRKDVVFTIDQVLKPGQRTQLRENVIEPFVNGGEILIAEAGMKAEAINLSPEDAQMLESRSFQIEEICRWFRVPPFMVGHTQKSTSWGTGLEQQQLGFLTFALEPYLERIEQAISRSLISAEDRKTLFAEFKVEKLLRADSAARAAFYTSMVTNGIYTRNEIRALENMPRKDGADDLTAQAQNVPVGQALVPRPAMAGADED